MSAVPTVDLDQLRARLGDPRWLLLDVLPRESHAARHLPGAVSFPLDELREALERGDDPRLPGSDVEGVIAYCGGPECPLSERAVELLHEHGYRNAFEFAGGLEEWVASGEPVLSGSSVAPASPNGRAPRPERHRTAASTASPPRGLAALLAGRPGIGVLARLIGWLEVTPTRGLFRLALGIVLGCAALYAALGLLPGHGLVRGGERMDADLLDALYFSFVTATTLGYGDVTPVGLARVVAVVEALSGLLLFGAVISKFLSRHQEQVVDEVHHLMFEERLSRVQIGLHLVVRELAELGDTCREPDADPERVGPRLESSVLVLLSQLRAVHDLLYRPQQEPDEAVLESILAGLDSALAELTGLLACTASSRARSPQLDHHLRTTATLAERICGDCVPTRHAGHLTTWMDRVQGRARLLAAG